MRKFIKLSILVALIGVTVSERAPRGRQQSTFKRGVVLSAPSKDGDIIEAEQVYGSGIQTAPEPHGHGGHDRHQYGLPHQDQAFIVTGGYKVSDGVLDGSFGGVTHSADGIKYGYDHEGPHHGKDGYHHTEYKQKPHHNDGLETNHLGNGYEQDGGHHFGFGPGPTTHAHHQHRPPSMNHGPPMFSHQYKPHHMPPHHQHERHHHHSPPRQMFRNFGGHTDFGPPSHHHHNAPSNHNHQKHMAPHFEPFHHRQPHNMEHSPSHGHPGTYVGFRGYGNYSPAYSVGLSHESHGHMSRPSHSSHSGYGFFG